MGNKTLILLVWTSCCSTFCLDALAQQAGGGSAAALQEIVVTATKRDEPIQDVPMAVTALTGSELSATQTFDLQDIGPKVPGLSLQQGAVNGFGAFGTRLIIRGENAGGGGAVVATTVDDVPFSFTGANSSGAYFATDLEPYDMQRIEVLRGPQGTLYGAAAEGGLIKYVTNAPDLTAFHAGIEGGALTVDHGGSGGSGKGFVNIPLIDGTLALRASGYYESIPGWIRDDLNNTTDINSAKRYGGRFSLLWQPTTDLSIRGTVSQQVLEVNGNDQVQVNGGTSSNPFGLENGYNFNVFLPNVGSDRATISSLNLDWNLHWTQLQSITSYGKLDVSFADDVPYYETVFGPGTTLTGYGSYPMKKFSQELRLVSETGNTLFGHGFDWQVGAFYTDEDVPNSLNYVTRGYPSGDWVTTALSPTTPVVDYDAVGTTYKDTALYLDGDFHFTSKFDIDAGVRVFHDKQTASTTQGGIFVTGSPELITPPPLASSETSATYSFAPRYHFTPDTMGYLRIASGFRPGGPQVPIIGGPSGIPTEFRADRTVNFELGIKSSLLDRRLSLDMDAFYIKWNEIQVPVIYLVNQVAYTPIQNAASAISKGVEWTIAWSPLPGLTIGTTGAYINAYFNSDVPGIGATDGERMAYVPKFAGNLNASYTWTLAKDLSAFISGMWSYSGSRFNDFTTYMQSVNSHIEIPSYTSVDAQVGLRKGKYFAQLYGHNLADSRGITSYSGFGADVTLIPGYAGLIRPRTFGFRVGGEF